MNVAFNPVSKIELKPNITGGLMEKNKSILFVDDERVILEILCDLFSDDGYDLHTATKAEDALNIVNDISIDFVLSDLKLPDSSGTKLLAEIQRKSPATVRVLTSGYLNVKFGKIGENKQDGTLYLSKPWDLVTLRRLVMESLG